MKVYELLGVKAFRKMAFALRDKMCVLFTLKMSKEKRRDYLYHTTNNYNLGKVKGLEDIKKFKKYLYMNTCIHICSMAMCFPYFVEMIYGTIPLPVAIANLTAIGINLYSIMLQRYNCIRINQLIKKMTPRYKKQKDMIKDELRKCNSLLLEHTYKIVDKKDKEISIIIEDLIANANIEELKRCREYLAPIQENEFYFDNQQINIPIRKNRTLKPVFKNNNANSCR